MKYKLLLCILFYGLYGAKAQQASLQLAQLFSSNMVLQQGIATPVWGTAKKGTTVSIILNGKQAVASVGRDGKWMGKLPPQQAGGPYVMKVMDEADTLVLTNVMIGEVWVCSGQSNMEMPVGNWGKVANYEQEIAGANYSNIRLMHLRKSASNTPEDEVQLYNKEQWQVCSPATIANFSAVAYFFAKNIYQKHPVAIGLIQATYGGTVAQAWVSGASLSTMSEFTKDIASIEKHPQQEVMKTYNTALQQWIQKTEPLDSGFANNEPLWNNEGNKSSWKNMVLPAYFDEAGLTDFSGFVWFKKKFQLTPEFISKDLTISIGSLGDEDIAYFNGVEIGRNIIAGKRLYTVPKQLIKAGENTLIIRLLVYHKYANIYGEGDRFSISAGDTSKIPLAGNWQYKIGYEAANPPPAEPDDPNRTTVLYNAMIHPLIPYGIRGVIWYQGEYNVGRAVQYCTLFPLLINDWRTHWKQGNFPFYFVQLANYKPVDTLPPALSEWAELREAQTYALKLRNTAMAVAIDLGEAEDIHPKNKQEVGRRLALIARAKLYGDDINYSSPAYSYYTVNGNKSRIFFTHIAGGLHTNGGTQIKGFTLAGRDHIFYNAHAILKNHSVIVYHNKVPHPKIIRYSWADNPVGNLYNGYKLPLIPFRTNIND